jgi:hypothetical protein
MAPFLARNLKSGGKPDIRAFRISPFGLGLMGTQVSVRVCLQQEWKGEKEREAANMIREYGSSPARRRMNEWLSSSYNRIPDE